MIPFYGLLLFVLLIPIESAFLSIGGGAATITRFVGIIVFGLWILDIAYHRRKIIFPVNLTIGLILVIWGGISILWATSQKTTIDRVMTAAQLIMLAILIINLINTPKKLNQLLVALFIGCAIALTLGMLGIGLKEDSYLLTLQDQSAKEYGSYVGIVFLIGSILLIFKKGKLRFVGLASVLITLIPLIRVNQRGIFLGLGVAWLVIAIITKQKFRTFFFIILVTVVISYLPGYLLQQGLINEYLAERLTIQSIIETGGTGRTEIWETGLRMFKDNWLLGVGWGNFTVEYKKYSIVPGPGKDPHGDLIGLACELGVIGFLIFISMYIRIFINDLKIIGQKNQNKYKIQTLIVISLMIFIFTVGFTSTLLYRKIYWIILGTGLAWPVILKSLQKIEDQRKLFRDKNNQSKGIKISPKSREPGPSI